MDSARQLRLGVEVDRAVPAFDLYGFERALIDELFQQRPALRDVEPVVVGEVRGGAEPMVSGGVKEELFPGVFA